MPQKPFSVVLKEFRTAAGLTQQELADATNSGRVYIAQLENGDRDNPALDVLQRLAKVLGADFADAVNRHCLRPSGKRKKSGKKAL